MVPANSVEPLSMMKLNDLHRQGEAASMEMMTPASAIRLLPALAQAEGGEGDDGDGLAPVDLGLVRDDVL